MSRGMTIRTALFLFGALPLVSLIHLFDVPPDVGGLAVILYAAAGGNYLGRYLVMHEGEVPSRPTRR